MPSIGISLNAIGESSGGILSPVPPRSHKLFLCCLQTGVDKRSLHDDSPNVSSRAAPLDVSRP
jgi:hypothetical protein